MTRMLAFWMTPRMTAAAAAPVMLPIPPMMVAATANNISETLVCGSTCARIPYRYMPTPTNTPAISIVVTKTCRLLMPYNSARPALSETPTMNWPSRVKRMNASNAASSATVTAMAGTSHALTAMLPTSVTGQKIIGKIVCGHVPNTSIAR